MRLQATCLLALALCQVAAATNLPRQTPSGSGTGSGTSAGPTSTTTSATSTSTTESASDTTSGTTTTTSGTTTTSDTTATTPTTNAPPTNTAVPPPPPSQTTILTTEADGGVATVVLTQTGTPTSSSATPSASDKTEEDDDGASLGPGAIAGMSVAGGLALIGIIAFFIWKFTRKRSTFDDNEAIKWPDLNSHSGADTGVALPAHTTGRNGGFDSQSETTGSLMHADNYSTADFSTTSDPYAVPPLPHLNPNQPYRDDPGAPGGYYDPYRGPTPGTLDHGTSDWHGEAIPMQQIQHQQTGGPMVPAGGYDQVGFEQPGYNAGRASPGPHAPFAGDQLGRTGSPAPMAPSYQQGGYDGGYHDGSMPPQAGRQSPGPQQAYGGRMSPGPNMAYGNAGYGQGPAPGYEAYGPR